MTTNAAPVTVHLRYVDDDGRLAHEVSLTWDNPHTAMWAGNAALPDGHPLKITRDDVRIVEEAARFLRECDMHAADDDEPAILALADKLAALLPPDA